MSEKYELVRLLWNDYAGVRRTRVVPRKRLEDIQETGVGFAYACLFLPSWGDVPPSSDPAGQATGECRLIPDLSTLQTLPWNPSESMVLLHMHREDTLQPWECCPRTVLSRALKLLEDEAGLSFLADFECEFTLFDASTAKRANQLPDPLDYSVYCQTSSFDAAAPFIEELCSSLEQLGQTVEQVHAESGPGQFEIATKYGPALDSADNLVFRKEAISAVARRHGAIASFLPKIWANQAGNGCHVHFSFVDIVTKEPAIGDESAPYGLSALGNAFAAGILRHMPALMPFIAANPNSYQRIQPSTWSGAFQCWGVNNREAPLRLVGLKGRPKSLNFELKIVDATANPYLVLAAIIAAGLSGIRNGYSLPEPVFGDPAGIDEEQRVAQGVHRLPASLEEALEALEKDEIFKGIVEQVLGSETLCRVYPVVKRTECEQLSGLSLEEQAAALYARF